MLETTQTAPMQVPVAPIDEIKNKKNNWGIITLIIVGVFLLILGGFYGYSLVVGKPMIALLVEDTGTTTVKTTQSGAVVQTTNNSTGATSGGGGNTNDSSPANPATNSTQSTPPTTLVQPPGTYPVYENGASSGTVVGYRYIQAPGVFEGAIKRAAEGNAADLALLLKTYGMGPTDIASAADNIAAGRTWVPGGVGCNDMPERTDGSNAGQTGTVPGSPIDCTIPHWTTCTNKGTGVMGVGCDVTVKKTSINDNPDSPTMSCSGLSSVPATTPAPTIGTKLTFTCAGSVSPSTAGTVSYKFQYSINSGTPVALTPLTATPNKAELTISACGTYKVQCQACATLNGVLTCSPTWTGATQ